MSDTIEIPDDGWQLDGIGPKIYAIGDDADEFLSFGTQDKSEFLRSCKAFASQVVGEPLDEVTVEDVEYHRAKVTLMHEKDEWFISWKEGVDTNCEITLLSPYS